MFQLRVKYRFFRLPPQKSFIKSTTVKRFPPPQKKNNIFPQISGLSNFDWWRTIQNDERFETAKNTAKITAKNPLEFMGHILGLQIYSS